MMAAMVVAVVLSSIVAVVGVGSDSSSSDSGGSHGGISGGRCLFVNIFYFQELQGVFFSKLAGIAVHFQSC